MDLIIGCLFLFFATGMALCCHTLVYLIYIEVVKDFTLLSLIRPDALFAEVLTLLTMLFFIKGFIMVWRYIDTRTKGVITYAMVVGYSRQSNRTKTGRTYYYYIDYIVKNEKNEIKKITKLEMTKQEIGTFVEAKQYKNNIIVIDSAKEEAVPQILKEKLISEAKSKYIKEEKNN